MYIVQRRKNEKSSWHTVKSSKGKYQAKELHVAILFFEKAAKEYPGKEHRIIDGKTDTIVYP